MDELSSHGRDGRDDLAELELVEDGGLTSGIETNHEDPHLLREQVTQQLPEDPIFSLPPPSNHQIQM